MGACYGAGILGSVPADTLDRTGREDFLAEFAAKGYCHGFREVVGDQVLEFTYRGGDVESRYLDRAEAAPIIAAEGKIGGSAPYSMFPICLPSAVMIPGFRGGETRTVRLPAAAGTGDVQPDEIAISPLRNCIERLRDFINEDDDSPEEEFARELLEQMELCREHRLIFNCGD